VKFALSTNDVKRINKLIAEKLSLLDFKDTIRFDTSAVKNNIANTNLSKTILSGSIIYPQNQLQVERVYKHKNAKMIREKSSTSNLLEKSYKKQGNHK